MLLRGEIRTTLRRNLPLLNFLNDESAWDVMALKPYLQAANSENNYLSYSSAAVIVDKLILT